MQLDVYVQKIKEYRVKIAELEEELQRFKRENDSLIDDLRDSKTKVAVLEEGKAQLQMEVTKLRKNQIMNPPVAKPSPMRIQQPTLNVTVNTQSYGVFGMGGKANYSVRVQPALT